jgi:EAL domain-containing protein (putative c-di-GMP-specific phosphodiesterase class I)
MGIRTIAEFVESQEVLDHLRLVEVDYAQGLVIGGPQKLA